VTDCQTNEGTAALIGMLFLHCDELLCVRFHTDGAAAPMVYSTRAPTMVREVARRTKRRQSHGTCSVIPAVRIQTSATRGCPFLCRVAVAPAISPAWTTDVQNDAHH
jgi:hypothetical protein